MSIDPKKFGLSNSLVNAVNEALKGNQHKIDVNKNGKIDAQDFKKLRGEELKGNQHKIDANKNGKIDANDFKKLRGEETPGKGEKHNYKHDMMKSEVADGNKANFKQNMKEEVEQIDELSSTTLQSYRTKALAHKSKVSPDNPYSSPEHKAAIRQDRNRSQGKQLSWKKMIHQGAKVNATRPKPTTEESVSEAAPAPAPNVAADMAARKTEIQRRIAAKQASMQLAKSNKRISGSPMKESSCSCGDTKESKMTCEVHGDKKTLKGGKEPIIMNPPLKEASNLPKAVVSKGHEIAKSLIKHKSTVKEPYAVGMAAAKKSAGIKEDAEQVDELSKGTLKSYKSAAKWDIDGIKSNAPSNYEFDRDAMLKRRQAGMKMANKKLNKKD